MEAPEEPVSNDRAAPATPDDVIDRLREAFSEILSVELWPPGVPHAGSTVMVLVSVPDDAWRERCTDLGRVIARFFADRAISALPTILPASAFPAAREQAQKMFLDLPTIGDGLDASLALGRAFLAFPASARAQLRGRFDWHDETLQLLRTETSLPPGTVLGLTRLVLQDALQLVCALHGKHFEPNWTALAATLPSSTAEALENPCRLLLLAHAAEIQQAWHAGLGMRAPVGSPVRQLVDDARKAVAAVSHHIDTELAARPNARTDRAPDRRKRFWLIAVGIGLAVALALLLRIPLDNGSPEAAPVARPALPTQPQHPPPPPEPAPLDVPLVTIRLGTAEARAFLLTGWSTDEQDDAGPFVWATGRRSEVSFQVERPRPMRLSMLCSPFIFPNAPPQTFSVWVNGSFISEHTLEPGDREYTATIPAPVLVAGANTLEFRYAYARVVRDVMPESTDARPLSVAWRTITLTPVPR